MSASRLHPLESNLADLAKFPEINPGPVCRMDKSGEILLANKAASRLFKDDLLTGKNWLNICPGLTEAKWQTIIRSGKIEKFETKIGDLVMLFTFVHAPETNSIYSFGNEVTSFREAQQELSRQAELLKEVARFPEMNPGPVLRVEFDGDIVLANNAARKIFGDNITGCNWLKLLPGMTKEKWQAILNSAEPVPVEAQIENCYYLFSHNSDESSQLVFVFGSDITLHKKAELALIQSEKMATLGTLAAGVAHELNNPAAATRRAAEQLRAAFSGLAKAQIDLGSHTLTPDEKEILFELEGRARHKSEKNTSLDPISQSDKESEIEDWFDENDIELEGDTIASLVGLEINANDLEDLKSRFNNNLLASLLNWASNMFLVNILTREIFHGSSRISEIIGALKNYSYLGQAPAQSVNVHDGIENTLIILRNKLKKGITINRQYGESIPNIFAYGSELNQVWTNLLDNAADAMKGRGQIIIRTYKDEDFVVVEVEDSGEGIPKEIQSKIFDPFFTTKEPGKGTGIGLATTYGIVVEKHKGAIAVDSVPGKTKFTVRLHINKLHL